MSEQYKCKVNLKCNSSPGVKDLSGKRVEIAEFPVVCFDLQRTGIDRFGLFMPIEYLQSLENYLKFHSVRTQEKKQYRRKYS